MMKTLTRFFFYVSFILFFVQCNSNSNSADLLDEETISRAPNVVEKRIGKDGFLSLVQQHESCYLFLTTDWCGGGELWLNNSVLPNLNRINAGETPLIVAYLGHYDRLGIIPDSIAGEGEITLYHLYDIGGNALLDKMAIRKILKKISPNLKYDWSVPIRVEVKGGQGDYIEKAFSEL